LFKTVFARIGKKVYICTLEFLISPGADDEIEEEEEDLGFEYMIDVSDYITQ